MDIDYAVLVEEHRDLVESMAWVAFGKIRRPSAWELDDLIQEGYIVCTEWVQRWFDPSKGASLRTFICGGLRNHFTDIVRKSFRDYPEQVETHETDLRKRSSEHGPEEMAIFNETFQQKLTEQHREYIRLMLVEAQKGPQPRDRVRAAMGITLTVEEYLRKDIRERLSRRPQGSS